MYMEDLHNMYYFIESKDFKIGNKFIQPLASKHAYVNSKEGSAGSQSPISGTSPIFIENLLKNFNPVACKCETDKLLSFKHLPGHSCTY